MQIKVNMSACIKKIMERGHISDKEAEKLLQEIADKGDYLRKKTGDPNIWPQVVDQYIEAIKLAQMRQRELAILGSAARVNGIKKSLGGDDWAAQANRADSLSAARLAARRTRSIMINENGYDFKGNAYSETQSIMRSNLAATENALRRANLTSYMRDWRSLPDIAKAMFDLQAGKVVTGGPAKAAAQILLNTFEALRKDANAHGANIQKAIDRAFHTVWDREQIISGGLMQKRTKTDEEAFQRFFDVMNPRFDPTDDLIPQGNETPAEARMRFWRSTYKAMATDLHEDPKVLNLPVEYEGTYNILKRLEDSRVLRPKSGEAWAEAIRYYGALQTPAEFLRNTIESFAKDIGMLKHGGPNFGANMRFIMQSVIKSMRDSGDVSAANEYRNVLSGHWTQHIRGRPGLDDILAQLGAIQKTPMNGMRSNIVNTALEMANLATLGALGQTHYLSLPSAFTAQARLNGVNFFRSLGTMISGLMPLGAAKKDLLSQLGAYVDGLYLQEKSPSAYGWSFPGTVSYLNSKLMTANGFRYVIRHMKNGWLYMLANHLADNVGKDFETINPELRERMLAYGIDATKWKLMREMTVTQGPNGRRYLTPDAAYRLTDAQIRQAMPSLSSDGIDMYRRDLAHQIYMYYSTTADHAVVTPGPREAALLHQRAGSTPLSFMTQFSAWPIASLHQQFAKSFTDSLTRGKRYFGLGLIMGLGMLQGYMRTQLLNLESNRPIEVPNNAVEASVVMATSMAKGGVLGILGDYILGNLYQGSGNSLSGMGGPVSQSATDLIRMLMKEKDSLMTGKRYNVWADAVHWAVPKIPFSNLFYLKGALDYLIWYHLFEAVQPGWWEKTRQKLQKQGKGPLAGMMPGAPIPYNPLTGLQNLGVGP